MSPKRGTKQLNATNALKKISENELKITIFSTVSLLALTGYTFILCAPNYFMEHLTLFISTPTDSRTIFYHRAFGILEIKFYF